jgi:hypothetical protein
MCRSSLKGGDWRDQIFTVINKVSAVEGRNGAVNEIAAFINYRSYNFVV